MAETGHMFLHGLAVHLYALDVADRQLKQGMVRAADSIRRIARSLHASSMQDGYPDVALAAACLNTATDTELPAHVDKFLALLRQVLGEKDADKIHFLIVSDDPASCKNIETALALPNRVLHIATTTTAADELLADREMSLIILDVNRPDNDGCEFMLRVRAQPLLTVVPVIVVSAAPATQPCTEYFALGADDYIARPFDADSFSACVAANLQRVAELMKWSRIDPLTGLPNRTSLLPAYNRARMACAAAGRPFSMAIVDIDRLKWVNDTFSHSMGDEVLRSVGVILTKTLRSSDIITRWGGEEFVCILPETPEEGARAALDKALQAMRDQDFHAPDGRTFRVTFSAGVIEVDPAHGFQESFSRTDQLLYLAKSSGRNQIMAGSHPVRVEKRVLLAEDDDLMATVLRGLLRAEGYAVSHLRDGNAALKEAAEHPSSLVILDVKMPGADGFEVLQRLRQMPGYSQTPILIVSGVSDSWEIEKGLSMGANDYIVKPFSPIELLARIKRLVKER